MKLTLVAGARPNFIKISAIINSIHRAQAKGLNLSYRLVHTGQHYSDKMSDLFFRQLNIPMPDINLNVGSGTQASQTGAIMVAFEEELKNYPTDLVIVVGDVNSTLACSIVAKKAHVKVAHVEGGIRSGDMKMPEEVNRIVTDAISDYFFTTSTLAGENLKKAGVREDQIFFVGNTMIDTLVANKERFSMPEFWNDEKLSAGKYLVLTLHRPSNVDGQEYLMDLMNYIDGSVDGKKIIFPVHPRTQKQFMDSKPDWKNISMVEPLGYLDFMYLVKNSAGVITDSGGITEEATFLHIPCITLRDSTERPETCTIGSNELVGSDRSLLEKYLNKMVTGQWKSSAIPPMWDGKTGDRIVEEVYNLIK